MPGGHPSTTSCPHHPREEECEQKRARHPPIFGRAREGDENRGRICVICKAFPTHPPFESNGIRMPITHISEGGDMVILIDDMVLNVRACSDLRHAL